MEKSPEVGGGRGESRQSGPIREGLSQREREIILILEVKSEVSFALQVKVKSLSRVRLFVTPWTVAYQAPPSMGFYRQEYWSGLPFPSPIPAQRLELAGTCTFMFFPDEVFFSEVLTLQEAFPDAQYTAPTIHVIQWCARETCTCSKEPAAKFSGILQGD